MKAAFLAVAAIVAAPVVARPAAVDWTRTAVATPEGGVRIGNPAAKVRLVEYGSFTCPHCGAFAREAFAPLGQRYLRAGRVSFEFRPALRDGMDMLAALTVWCGGPARFMPLAHAVYAGQDKWIEAGTQWAEAHPDELKGAGVLSALAQNSGIAAIAAQGGLPAPQYARCLADQALTQRLAKTAADAWNVRKIGGTPAFYLNDEKLDGVYGWAALETRLRAAVAG